MAAIRCVQWTRGWWRWRRRTVYTRLKLRNVDGDDQFSRAATRSGRPSSTFLNVNKVYKINNHRLYRGRRQRIDGPGASCSGDRAREAPVSGRSGIPTTDGRREPPMKRDKPCKIQ